MKFKLTNLILIAFIGANLQLSANCKRDTIKTCTVSPTGVKTYTARTINTFDAIGNVLTETNQTFTNNSWTNNRITTNTYNASNQLLTSIAQMYDVGTSTWRNNSKIVNTYSGNHITENVEMLWSGSINDWYENKRYSRTYNAQGKVLTQIYKNQTVNVSNTIFEYDNNQNETLMEYKQWQSNAWVNNNKIERTFDANSNKLTEINYFWNAGSYNYGQKLSYTYDNMNRETEALTSNWNQQTNEWFGSTRKLSSYGSNGLTLVSNQGYYGPQEGWKTISKNTYSYNSSGWVSEIVTENLNFGTLNFENFEKKAYTYNVNGKTTTFTYSYWVEQINNFRPQSREAFEYNSSDLETKKTMLSFSDQTGFVPFQEFTKEYNTNNELSATETKGNFNVSNNTWNSIFREEYYCSAFQNTKLKMSLKQQITIYPNPANTNIHIKGINNLVEVNIYNQMGQLVLNAIINSENETVDLSPLNEGIYFVRIDNQQSLSQTLIIKH
jgi:hypothetical protein